MVSRRSSSIDCEHVILAISDYIDDEVDASLLERIQAHLSNCNHCLAIHDGTRNLLRLVADGEVLDVPSDFSARLFSRLESILK